MHDLPRDLTITHHDVPLAVRDHGGDGPPVILLHGLGGTVEAWDEVAPELGYRAVAIDLRGHGHSGDGPWDWDVILDDIEVVVRHLGLGTPPIVGHSMGGMIAMRWAGRHPECPAVVNLDGLRSAQTDPENYPGMDPDERDRSLTVLKGIFDGQQDAATRPLTAEQRRATPRRSTTTRDGQTYLRPSAELLASLREDASFRDAIPLLRRLTCPTLVVLSTLDPPGAEGSALMAAHRRGVRRDLTGLPGSTRVAELDASHNMVAEKPVEVAALIRDFLMQVRPAAQEPGETSPVS